MRKIETLQNRLDLYETILGGNSKIVKAINQCQEKNIEEIHFLHTFAPTLMEFVEWLLEDALKRKIKRLYFLARDGWMPYLIATLICEKRGIKIDCRYIRVSRYAIRIPEYHILQEGCLDRICTGGIDVTFNKIMKRTGISDESIEAVANKLGVSEDEREKVLSYKEVKSYIPKLAECKDFLQKVYEHSKNQYDNALEYLRKNGFLEKTKYAIVDSGWVGTTQQSLLNLLKTADKDIDMEGYYFGLYEIPKGEKIDKYHSFYFSPTKDIKNKISFSNSLFETVLSEPNGMTLYYNPEPVLDEKANPNSLALINRARALQNFTKIYLETAGEKTSNPKDTIYEILRLFMGNPLKEEVVLYGDNHFCDDLLDDNSQEVAAVLETKEIKNQRFINKALIMTGIKKGVIHESAWIEGSIVRNDDNVNSNLRHARAYKRFVYLKKAWKNKKENNTDSPSKS